MLDLVSNEAARRFSNHRQAALALLSAAVERDEELPGKVANFLGACCGYRTLTPRMAWWLSKLLADEGMPPFREVQ